MKFLFFFVHPSKYHFFKQTINQLILDGHQVKVAIISKDVLEDLVKQENWDYVNLFPEGRRSKSTNRWMIILYTIINLFKTLYRLHKLISKKEYKCIITDDLATITAKYRKIPSIVFTDNELTTVPGLKLILFFADKILMPKSLKMKEFANKQICFDGFKESAYLHPLYFKPDDDLIKQLGLNVNPYFLIRSVSMTASHDIGIKGLTDTYLNELVSLLSPHGKVFISSERPLPNNLKALELIVPADKILSVLYHARLFIGDSGTMSSEAALLGTPSFMFHNFIGRLGVMKEKEKKYGIMFGYNQHQFLEMKAKINEMLNTPNLKEQWQDKRAKLFSEHGDVNEFILKLLKSIK